MQIDLPAALANPEGCCLCGRKVSAKALDSNRASWITVDGYNLVLGAECAKKVSR